MKYRINFIVGVLLMPILALAQPSNDFCLDAIRINNVSKFCSTVGQYTNAAATFNPDNGGASQRICWW
jgi:hypothetical protein